MGFDFECSCLLPRCVEPTTHIRREAVRAFQNLKILQSPSPTPSPLQVANINDHGCVKEDGLDVQPGWVLSAPWLGWTAGVCPSARWVSVDKAGLGPAGMGVSSGLVSCLG